MAPSFLSVVTSVARKSRLNIRRIVESRRIGASISSTFDSLEDRCVPAFILTSAQAVELTKVTGAIGPISNVQLVDVEPTAAGARVLGRYNDVNNQGLQPYYVNIDGSTLSASATRISSSFRHNPTNLSPNAGIASATSTFSTAVPTTFTISGGVTVGVPTYGPTTPAILTSVDVSDNGVAIVNSPAGAFWYSPSSRTPTSLDALPAQSTSISADGSVISGHVVQNGLKRATVWTNGVRSILGVGLSGNYESEALDVSPNGLWAVGVRTQAGVSEAVLWNLSNGTFRIIPKADGTTLKGRAAGVTNDGFVVGSVEEQTGSTNFIWNRTWTGGARINLADYLVNTFNVNIPFVADLNEIASDGSNLYLINGTHYVRFAIAEDVVINGTSGADNLVVNLADYVSARVITINGLGGNDSILVYGSTATAKTIIVNGDAGNDSVFIRDDLLGSIRLEVNLGDGADRLEANSAGSNVVMTVTGGAGRDFIATGAGNDIVTDEGSTGGYVLTGAGSDGVTLNGSEFVVTTGDGNDSIAGVYKNSFVFTENNLDTIVVGGSGNTIWAGAGVDNFRVNGANNTLLGEGDHDVINVLSGSGNTAFGNDGNDLISFNGANNSGSGGNGNDQLVSEFGFNVLDGGAGADSLSVRRTSETLLIGGSGEDSFVALDSQSKTALILDFDPAVDRKSGF